jgi:rod shape-determining protein MreC
VSAVVQREERTQGIVTCDNGVFYLGMVPIRAAIDSGDAVVSSGMGEVFPKGLLVGHVASASDEEQGLFREVILTPSVDFAKLEEVFVLKQTANRPGGE